MSLFGALPFVFTGAIDSYLNAVFETVSGFTTTGASILSGADLETLPKSLIMWRSFTHWVGGMGVLVFVMAVVSNMTERSIHIMRAEMPGHVVGKLVPRGSDTAKILYIIYIVMTILNVAFLLFGKMAPLEAVCTALGTAGTGGFGVRNDSMASYSPYIQNVTTVFMFLFGVNFSCYYLLLLGQLRSVFRDGELRLYIVLAVCCVLAITANVCISAAQTYDTVGEVVRHAAFQVSSIITTTGYTTTDYDLWPSLSKGLLMMLMVVGACAGSTGGGIKCARVLLIFKSLRRNIRQVFSPNKVQVVRSNGRPVNEKVLSNTNAYLAAYVIIIIACFLLISVDGYSMETNFSATLACFNNIGPGMAAVGPTCNFSIYSNFSKIVLSLAMLAGRLEIFPILALFSRGTWKKG
jgi:trk system potassium uptake protein TrkH